MPRLDVLSFLKTVMLFFHSFGGVVSCIILLYITASWFARHFCASIIRWKCCPGPWLFRSLVFSFPLEFFLQLWDLFCWHLVHPVWLSSPVVIICPIVILRVKIFKVCGPFFSGDVVYLYSFVYFLLQRLEHFPYSLLCSVQVVLYFSAEVLSATLYFSNSAVHSIPNFLPCI